MKKVVVISSSLRPGSNSHALAEQFAKGAEAAGHQVELISLRGKEIKFCVGCLSCQQTGACIFKDDVPVIMERVLNADVVCWATLTSTGTSRASGSILPARLPRVLSMPC